MMKSNAAEQDSSKKHMNENYNQNDLNNLRTYVPHSKCVGYVKLSSKQVMWKKFLRMSTTFPGKFTL
jgi:hypothetical protein